MIPSDRLKDPQTLFRIGMLCLLLGILAPWLLHPAAALGQDLLDGARGALYGLSIGLCLWAARLRGRRRCGESGG